MGDPSSIQLGCAHLGAVRHVCAFFNDDEEAYRVLLPFIADGFLKSEKAIHVIRPDRLTDHVQRLAGAGIDTAPALASGQLDLRSSIETYLSDGRFDVDRMLAAFEAIAEGRSRYRLSRIVCDMDWAAESPPVLDDLIEFEARVNDVWRRHDDIVICSYNVTKLPGDVVIDIMRTHPVVLIGDVLQENPFFVPPDEFLRARAERRSDTSGRP